VNSIPSSTAMPRRTALIIGAVALPLAMVAAGY